MAQDLYIIKPFKNEFLRKALHLPVFIFPVLAMYSFQATIILLTILIIGYLLIIILEKKQRIKFPIFSSLIQFCYRNNTYDLGPVYLALGMMGALLISSPIQAFYAAYIIAICDGSAAIIGMFYGKHKIFGLKKSLEGSFVFFVLCFIGGMYFLSPLNALYAAAMLTLMEIISIRGLDNLTLPVLSQLLLRALMN